MSSGFNLFIRMFRLALLETEGLEERSGDPILIFLSYTSFYLSSFSKLVLSDKRYDVYRF